MNLENANIAEINEKLNEIDSHIELAKEETIDTIKEVETEVCSDIIRKNKELKEDNITTRNLVRQKTKKIDENVSKLADRQEKTDKMIESEADEIEKLIEQNIDFEADEIEKQIQEQIDKEIEEIESNQSNQSNDGNNNGTEGEVQGTPN
jgi:signal transduction histidine kinase